MKFAVIGTWGHFGEVLREIDEVESFECVGWARAAPDDDVESARKNFQKTAQSESYTDYSRLLLQSQPDLVIISTRLDRITDIALEVSEKGCHIVCEKPLAITEKKLYQLWNSITAHGVQCLAMLNNRCHPLLAAGQDIIYKGDIGEVRLLNARKSYKFGNRPEWFGQRFLYGGTIPWIGIHALDFIETVTSADFVSVSAIHSNVSHPERPDCEDIAGILTSLSNGGLATISIDYLRPDTAATHGDDWLRAVGTEGCLEIELASGKGRVESNKRGSYKLQPLAGSAYYTPRIKAFPTAGTATPNTDSRRSFALTHAALCAREAADRGIVKPVPDAPWDRKI